KLSAPQAAAQFKKTFLIALVPLRAIPVPIPAVAATIVDVAAPPVEAVGTVVPVSLSWKVAVPDKTLTAPTATTEPSPNLADAAAAPAAVSETPSNEYTSSKC